MSRISVSILSLLAAAVTVVIMAAAVFLVWTSYGAAHKEPGSGNVGLTNGQPGRSTSQPIHVLPTVVPSAVPPLVSDGGGLDDELAEPVATVEPTGTMVAEIPPVTHVVQPGENLFRISVAYGVPMETIMATNGIVDPRLVYTGQSLVIPLAQAIATPIEPVTDVQEVEAAQNPVVTPAVTLTPIPLPPPVTTVNGISLDRFLVMPQNVIDNCTEVFARGQALRRNPRAFSKVGDSTIENPFFLARFDEGPYNLGDYGYLQAVIDYYAGSFGRQGMAVKRGFHSWTVNDPMWADKGLCLPNESPIACEVRMHNPSVVLVRLGSNDAGVPAGFEQNLRQIVDFFIQSGVIPVLGTKADRFEGVSNINNQIIRQVAADYQVPLWDFDLVAQTIPGRGLDIDAVHLTTFYAHDYTSPVAFQRGHGVHNLTALMVLDAVWREVIERS